MRPTIDKIRGYTVVFGSPSEPDTDGEITFRETIERGAVQHPVNVSANVMHELRTRFAATWSHDLRIWEDSYGIAIEADLARSADGVAIRNMLQSGGDWGLSPRLQVRERTWAVDDRGQLARITDCKIEHVALADRPIFPENIAWLRSTPVERMSPRVRAAARRWQLGQLTSETAVARAKRLPPTPILIDGLTPLELFCSPRCDAMRGALNSTSRMGRS